ncbi:hypothetical protein PPUJ20005_21840 [Pseudomonas putida]|nr:hypothetical protein PPUJ20005_21840 [Pseudomonas putida]GLO24146.1 hypothetical protein PPUJ21368_19740 [Pseudomonas putida]
MRLAGKGRQAGQGKGGGDEQAFHDDSGNVQQDEATLVTGDWQLPDSEITTLSAWACLRFVTYHFSHYTACLHRAGTNFQIMDSA